MTPKLSIIVPVYNVQDYICECIDSILTQPFQDFEILLIDDGSKDNSRRLCDEYALKDSRIKVCHKKNGGLSSARNYGLEKCTGEYISFIDSDDYLVGDYYTKPIGYLDVNPTIDIVWLQYAKCYENGEFKKVFNESDKVYNKDSGQLLNLFVTKEAFAGLKLYRRKVFQHIRYPQGQILEDLYIVPDLYECTSKCAILSIKGYYVYRQRCNSISKTKHTSGMIYDIALAYSRIISLCKRYDRKLYIRTLATYSSGYLNALVLFPDHDFKDLKEIYEKFSYDYVEILTSTISIAQKLKLFILKMLGYNRMIPFYKYIYNLKHKQI